MTTFIAIDGGVHESAVATFVDGRLADVRFVPSATRPTPVPDLRMVIVERPQIDGRAPRPQDIVDLAWASASLAYSYGVPVHAVEPRAWKGSVPKPVHHARMLLGPLTTLLPAEAAALDRRVPGWARRVNDAADKLARGGSWPGARAYGSWTGHNLLDAVCLGLWARDRLARGIAL